MSVKTSKKNSVGRGYGKKRGRVKGSIVIPQPTQVKAKEMYGQGICITDIAKELGHAWITIAKIVKTRDLDKYLEEMEQELGNLVPDAIESIRKGLKQKREGAQLGLGLIRNFMFARKKQPIIINPQQNTLVVNQPSITEQDQTAVKKIISSFAEMAIETHKVFGMDMPEMESVQKKKVETHHVDI